MDLDQQDEAFFLRLIEVIYSQRPSQVSVNALTDFAKQVWYGELDLVPLLESRLVNSSLTDEQRRYLLYLIDRLICYPCIPHLKAIQLRALLKDWSELKPSQPSAYAVERVAQHILDRKAFEWGLEEDVTLQMKGVLQYQTRHYAASLGRKTGYSES